MKRILNPQKIEAKSFEIIDEFLLPYKFPFEKKQIIQRVIHATTELNYIEDLIFHPLAIKKGVNALKNGADIICDSSMVKVGINNQILSDLGGKVICLISDDEVIKKSKKFRIARAILSMRKSAKFMDGAIIAIGNAPTALFEVCKMVKRKKIKPALIIGIPVGFVGAVEAKNNLTKLNCPHITNKSEKGGSAVAAAITNAVLKLAEK